MNNSFNFKECQEAKEFSGSDLTVSTGRLRKADEGRGNSPALTYAIFSSDSVNWNVERLIDLDLNDYGSKSFFSIARKDKKGVIHLCNRNNLFLVQTAQPYWIDPETVKSEILYTFKNSLEYKHFRKNTLDPSLERVKFDLEKLIPTHKISIKECYQEWLDLIEWDLFTTLTFKNSTHPEQATKCFNKWMRLVNQTLYGKRFREKKKGVAWVRGLEYQKRGVIHFHVLIKSGKLSIDPEKRILQLLYIKSLWQSRINDNCGFADIGTAKHEAAVRYIVKYILKGSELDFSGSFDEEYTSAFAGEKLLSINNNSICDIKSDDNAGSTLWKDMFRGSRMR